MDKDSKIYVAGHNGLVGSAIVRELKGQGYTNIIFRTHNELDLTNEIKVNEFFEKEKPEYVFLAAAKVGGILANDTYPVEFITINLQIQTNVITNAYKHNVKKLLFLGSSCIYPKLSPQPIKEEYLMTGALESTNDAYAIAKIAGIKMCQSYNNEYGTNFISVMPTNLYGPNDNFDLKTSHVLPALVRKFIEAKDEGKDAVLVWGTGNAKREFLFVDDLAEACIFLMNNYNGMDLVNIGVGEDISIKDLASLIKEIVGFEGIIEFDTTKPDGTMQKLLDVNRIKTLGWIAKTELKEGLKKTIDWYLLNNKKL